ncbi:hypothetical protein [Flavobacterium sp.]|jgi:hypothetical protein|uniref:hypothetical protein n=1 Tax=Flavobacterium sp. TaxID=239 RepID=UPI0022BE17DD|nr:hypothetical protein [Flavobacterium sp.]MCZ8145011.1 hypothetical protein [Flavobacterium sp.]MCZ8368013.1 hypothetical protein [Flavobacterium sp.]
MKTTKMYLGLAVLFISNFALAHGDLEQFQMEAEDSNVTAFVAKEKISKPETASEIDAQTLQYVLAPVVGHYQKSTEEEIEEGYKITDTSPQSYQWLTIEPTLEDMVRFNESVIESNQWQQQEDYSLPIVRPLVPVSQPAGVVGKEIL